MEVVLLLIRPVNRYQQTPFLSTHLPVPQTGAWDPEAATLDDIFRSQVVVLEHVVRLPVTQLRGVAAVVDCAGLSMNHAYHLTPTHIRRMISVIQVGW